MKALEEYEVNNFKVVQRGKLFHVYREGEYEAIAATMRNAKEYIEAEALEYLRGEFEFECGFCNAFFNEDEIHQVFEDNTSMEPYGDTFVKRGSVEVENKCPICGREVEEC